MKEKILNPFVMLCLGLLSGIVARLLDIYTANLGEIFSQMATWILLGTLIAIYSPTKKKAMWNLLLFCLGMLITYYAAAIITDGVYGSTFLVGWSVFALLSPGMAYLAWMVKEKGVFPKIIGAGIVMVSALSSVLLFDRLRVYDIVIDGLLIYFVFFQKISR